MNRMSESPASPGKDSIETLLEKAPLRAPPPVDMEEQVRSAVRSNWEAATNRRRRQRLSMGLAFAATITLILAISFSGLRQTGIAPVTVASIDKSVGTLFVQSGDTDVQVPIDTSSLVSGQTLVTSGESVAGLNWLQGGSLRIDSTTRIEFVAGDEVFLHDGRIYFDSFGADSNNGLSIRTAHGVVSHVGTQYLTEATPASLTVSVREGEVMVDGNYHDWPVYEGQRVQMIGSNQPMVTNTSGSGTDWQWIEAVSPSISIDGMTVFDFVYWVGRETGHAVEFGSDEVETVARNARLKGTVNAPPRAELRLRMMTVDLHARFDPEDRKIIVTN